MNGIKPVDNMVIGNAKKECKACIILCTFSSQREREKVLARLAPPSAVFFGGAPHFRSCIHSHVLENN